MRLPHDHPQRRELNDEVHARPPESLTPPLRLSFLAMVSGLADRDREREHVAELAQRFGQTPPAPGSNHYSADLGPFRLKWERHTEFARYKVIVPGADDYPFAEPAIWALPAGWVEALPGQVMVAAHAALVPGGDGRLDYEAISARLFGGNVLVGSGIAGGAAMALTDLRVHGDGFSRFLILDRGMTPRQAGRMVQRLLELETYRMLALLALPVARGLAPHLDASERELARVTAALANNALAKDEPALLDRLTRLEAEIEDRQTSNHYRFSAATAYHELVQRRIEELREERIHGLQTFHEFTERRLAPAMSTCRAVAARQESLSRHVARATQLLSTRVDVARERQNQAVLESMNRRAKMQLRLQQTVEGLSVAAVTYYVVGLVGYAAKGLNAAGVGIDPDVAQGVSVPVILLLVAFGIRRIKDIVVRKRGHSVNLD
jgi:uncharacterized membrane-anchored protein